MATIYNFASVYIDWIEDTDKFAQDNDWFHPREPRCKKIRKSSKNHKKKSKK